MCIRDSNMIGANAEGMHTLPNLTALYLSHNDLIMLEEEIGDFPKLTQLDISYNKLLQSVPYSLGDLEKLSSLCLQGCALTVREGVLLNLPTVAYYDTGTVVLNQSD